ncbi:hypothetical protein D915_004818 [Fasciola hepatica]|uniref:Lysosome-associated membrane glycoprotein n=1 Tax=Fasciola hepatica TaxID=6192 RepID=A0A4E0RDE9_FASHE|nr:hypothetical protein D915_004818 [Fasciola hepatica]
MLGLCNTPQTDLSSIRKMNRITVDSKQLVFFVVSLWAMCMQLEAKADPSAEKNAQYSIKDREGNYCLLMNFTADLSFTYTKAIEIEASSADTWGSAPVFSYYHCMAPKLVKFSVKKPVGGLEMRLTDVMLEAFMSKKKSQYSDKETLCDEDQTPDNTVPVAVGIALAVCIVIALIVFIVFNQRNRRRYGSV